MVQTNGSCCSVKVSVREKYDAIAQNRLDSGYCMVDDIDYQSKSGYYDEADLGLGCGSPVDHADLKESEKVLDLGSGAGLDAMIASPLVGKTGVVQGVDISPLMVRRAQRNAANTSIENVSFMEGDIEHIPFGDSSFDVVISNCTLNLVPDQAKVFAEIARVLRPHGRFVISDVVTVGDPDPALLRRAEEIAGCVAGAAEMNAYLDMITSSGFLNVEVVRFRPMKIVDHQDGLASVTIRAHRSS
ncbi:MAG: methyltransferase domain-containing protein [Bacteroidetes bacterium]|nr:methyltransferase domain-containing protein [Bacteroidota bacterium]